MKKIILSTVLLSVFVSFSNAKQHKIEYGLAPVAFMFPVGENFRNNFDPSVGFGLYGFYNVWDFLAVGLDNAYTFHFVNKTHQSYKVKLIRVSPSVKLQKRFNKFKVYAILGYGMYRWTTTEYRPTPAVTVTSKSKTVGGFNSELGVMYDPAPRWEIGINAGYNYANEIIAIKPARYFSAAIKAGYKL